jgi:hypothetical protein
MIRLAETGVSVFLFSYRHFILAVPTYVFSLITTPINGIDIDPIFGGSGVRKLVSPFVSFHTDTLSWLYPHTFSQL